MLLAIPMEWFAGEAVAQDAKLMIFDSVGLLNIEEYNELNALANQYGAERETDIIIFTINSPAAYDVKRMTQDFYDEYAPGYDKPHGNAVILMVDMTHREVYLAGFYKAKTYLDDERLDKIRDKITPDLTNGDYKLAFQKYIQTAHKYMGFRPGVNPDNIFFNIWVQLGISLSIGGIIVTLMVRSAGGRITVNAQTYEDASTSGLLDCEDTYLHTSTTSRKIESSSSSSGSSGGGGTTSGGHSHSGSRGSF
nr:TPM domain-containing protein [Paenibacillus apiarius]